MIKEIEERNLLHQKLFWCNSQDSTIPGLGHTQGKGIPLAKNNLRLLLTYCPNMALGIPFSSNELGHLHLPKIFGNILSIGNFRSL